MAVRVMVVAVVWCLATPPTPAFAGWFGTPCPKGPDGHCVQVPCEPYLDQIRALASARQKADDPGCPDHQQASALADRHQQTVDREQPKMSTACIRKAVPIMRPVASIDVLRSYPNDAGRAVALVRYTNNTQEDLQEVTISCSAIHEDRVVAVGKRLVPGPIANGVSRELPVMIDLAGATFSCVRCELTSER